MAPNDEIEQRFTAAVKLAVATVPARAAPAGAAIPAGLIAEIAAVAASLSQARSARHAVMVAAPDRCAFWVFQDSGVIHHSTDRRLWLRQPSGTEHDLLAGAALSSAVCWAVGRAGTILRTADGVSWACVPSPTDADLIGVIAASADAATIAAKDGRRYSTCDCGVNWQACAGAAGRWQHLGNGRRAIIIGGRKA